MKKLMIVFCLLAFVLTGCGRGESETSDALNIEDYSWQMTTIQSTETDGQAIAHAPGAVGVPDTSVEVILKCTATNGELNLTDETNGNTYTGSYKLTDTNQETRIYEVTVGDSEGMAVVSMTVYHDDSHMPAFIISLGDYALNFVPLTE